MTYICAAVREMLIEHRGQAASNDRGLHRHLDECSECSEFASKTKALAVLVSSLPRRPAPGELAGLVVAATQAGHRQERAARALNALSRRRVPSELEVVALDEDRSGDDAIRAKAPAVLDRLVDQDLRDHAAAISKRFAGRLDRRTAPAALRERVASADWTPLIRRRIRLVLPLAAGVALLVLVGVRFLGGDSKVEEATDGFQVVYETSLDSMDPMARGLLSGLTGGVVDVHDVSGTRTDGGAR